MTQFEKAVFLVREQIEEGKVIAVEETSSFLATIYVIPYNPKDDHLYVTYKGGAYEDMHSCSRAEMREHYDEAKAEGVKIWEREENDE